MKKIKEIASKYQVSEETVRTLLEGLKVSGGRQVQFNIRELGGMGQWQSGGMVSGAQQLQSNRLKNLNFTYPGGTVSLKDLKKVK